MPARPHHGHAARTFTLRVWAEPVAGGIEHRGSVRDVATGAHCSFRDWPTLTQFLAEQVDDDRPTVKET